MQLKMIDFLIKQALLLLLIYGPGSCSYIEEEKIFVKVFNKYNLEVKPSQKANDPVVTNFDVKLKSINNLSPKEQVIGVDVFVVMAWQDPRLTWNSTLYNDTDVINVGRTKIWTPDILLYNRAVTDSSSLHTDIYTSKVLVFSNGMCIWRNLVTLHASCALDLTWFPVDRQTCSLNFGSWSYSRRQLKLQFLKKPSSNSVGNIKADQFGIDSGEWEIDSFKAEEENIKFSCCPESFSSIKYSLTVSRISLYYFIYILLPLISLAFMFVLIFHIPPESGERMGFGVTILLAITVYLLVISEKLPEKSDDTPMIGVCFITIFYILVLALSLASGTTVFARRTSKPPEWIRKLTKKGCFKQKKDDQTTKIQPVDSITLRKIESDGNIPELFEEDYTDYNGEWIEICRTIDKKLFVFFNVILVLVPIIIVVSLPASNAA